MVNSIIQKINITATQLNQKIDHFQPFSSFLIRPLLRLKQNQTQTLQKSINKKTRQNNIPHKHS